MDIIKKISALLIMLLAVLPGIAGKTLSAGVLSVNTAPVRVSSISTVPETMAAGIAEQSIGASLPLWSIIPFAGILLSIALLPLLAGRFWHRNFPRVSLFWSAVFALPFMIFYRGPAVTEILTIMIIDYIPFIILIWSLYTISGGIYLKGSSKETPGVNTLMLLLGTILASLIGTTGASMLMIRTVIRTNFQRKYKVHTIVFFIFLVSNIGGSLTPLGDPPLFLGFLHGVPFLWTFKLFPAMGFATIVLLIVYYLLDKYYYSKEDIATISRDDYEPLKLEGAHNFIFLAGVVVAVLFSGLVKLGSVSIMGVHQNIENIIKDLVLAAMGMFSLAATQKRIRRENSFDWGPMKEVAYLFAGIFMTIIPALAILRAGESGALAFFIKATEKPAHYFWATGGLSSFLDNAPTYLTFFQAPWASSIRVSLNPRPYSGSSLKTEHSFWPYRPGLFLWVQTPISAMPPISWLNPLPKRPGWTCRAFSDIYSNTRSQS